MASIAKLLLAGACLLLVAGLCGCGGSAQSSMARHENAFNAAPAELKAQWQDALNAARSKDYAAALGALNKIAAATNLEPQQADAVREVSTSVSDEMYDAANKGDPKAKQAIDDLRKARGH